VELVTKSSLQNSRPRNGEFDYVETVSINKKASIVDFGMIESGRVNCTLGFLRRVVERSLGCVSAVVAESFVGGC
jgi:hypothetical protein